MSGKPRTLTIGLIAAALFAGSCGGGEDSIAGTYNCGQEGETPHDLLELREDETLTFTPGALPGAPPDPPPPEEGTWSVEGDSGTFDFGSFEDQFTIEGENIVFAHAGSPDQFVCTPQA